MSESARDYFERQHSERIVMTRLPDSARDPWFRAFCLSDNWYTEGRESLVEELAYEHLADAHPSHPPS